MRHKFRKTDFDIKNVREYTAGVKIITLSVITMMLILICIYFIKTYADKKHSILFQLQTEAHSLETSFASDMRYSSHFSRDIFYRATHTQRFINLFHFVRIGFGEDKSIKKRGVYEKVKTPA